MERASRVILSEKYDGTNGQAILAMVAAITQYSGNVWTIASDDGAVLRLKETSPGGLVGDWPIMQGQVVVVAPDTGIIARMSPTAYAARYRAIDNIVSDAVAANVAAIATSAPVQDAIKAEVAKATYGGFGVAQLPALLIGATSAPIDVLIKPSQLNDGFVARAFAVSGGTVLSSLTVVSAVNKDAQTVTVVVKNDGVVTLSGILLVHITSPSPTAAATKK